MQYEYKVVPFEGKIKETDPVGVVSLQLMQIINEHASQGWELYTIGEINIRVSPGCLSALFGAKDAYVKYNQIIFRRLRQGAAY